jgi:hypothetical protein
MTRLACILAALLATGCATMPDLDGTGLPLGKSGWQMTGGADFEKKLWFVTFWRPWGKQEKDAAIDADRIVLPE